MGVVDIRIFDAIPQFGDFRNTYLWEYMRVSFRQGLFIFIASATDSRVIFRLGSIASTSTCDSSGEVIVLELVPSPFSSFLCYLRIFCSSQNLFQHFI